jgi:hypothetical protein
MLIKSHRFCLVSHGLERKPSTVTPSTIYREFGSKFVDSQQLLPCGVDKCGQMIVDRGNDKAMALAGSLMSSSRSRASSSQRTKSAFRPLTEGLVARGSALIPTAVRVSKLDPLIKSQRVVATGTGSGYTVRVWICRIGRTDLNKSGTLATLAAQPVADIKPGTADCTHARADRTSINA